MIADNEETENVEIVKEEFETERNINREMKKEIGGGFGFFGGLCIEAKANFGIYKAFSVSPSLDYYLENAVIIGVDGHYNFQINDAFTLYPLLGLSYVKYRYSFLKLNIGGGMNYAVSDKIKIYSELKYVGGIAISAGVLVSL